MTEKRMLKRMLPMKLQLFAGEEVTVEQEVVTEEVVETPEVATVVDEVVTETGNSESDSKIAELEAKISELTLENSELKQKLQESEAKVTELSSDLADKTKAIGTKASEIESYQKSLEEIVAEKEKEIPDTVKALMPEGINVTEKLAWLNKAEALKPAEIETVEEPEQIISIGKPTPVTTEVIDQSELTTTQRMSNFFGEFFGTEK